MYKENIIFIIIKDMNKDLQENVSENSVSVDLKDLSVVSENEIVTSDPGDLLSKDKEIKNQKFVLMSFLSPEHVNMSEYNKLYEKISNETDLKKKCSLYEELLEFKKTVRGIKIRGVFKKVEDAQEYAKTLRDNDQYFDIYVGSVGEWMPWDDSSKTQESVYVEKQLNDLMSKYYQQQKDAKKELEQRIATNVPARS